MCCLGVCLETVAMFVNRRQQSERVTDEKVSEGQGLGEACWGCGRGYKRSVGKKLYC